MKLVNILGAFCPCGQRGPGGGSGRRLSVRGHVRRSSFAVESAIVDRVLVIDYVSHVGEMLNPDRCRCGQ